MVQSSEKIEVKYGEREIAEGTLITFPNPRPGRNYDIQITLPEYTCKCPFLVIPILPLFILATFPIKR